MADWIFTRAKSQLCVYLYLYCLYLTRSGFQWSCWFKSFYIKLFTAVLYKAVRERPRVQYWGNPTWLSEKAKSLIIFFSFCITYAEMLTRLKVAGLSHDWTTLECLDVLKQNLLSTLLKYCRLIPAQTERD